MKLRYLLLIAIAVIIPAQFASASSADPTVIVNRCNDCDAVMFSSNSALDPLVVTLNSQGLFPSETFEYTGTKTLTELFVELVGATTGEQFFCKSDIFTGPCGSFVTGLSDADGLIFTGGSLTHDELFTLEVATPEPGTIVLLLTGGVLLIGLGRRW